jgi:hypothetical protein
MNGKLGWVEGQKPLRDHLGKGHGQSPPTRQKQRNNKTEKRDNKTQTPRTNRRRVAPTRKRQRKDKQQHSRRKKENNETAKHPGQITDGSHTYPVTYAAE